MFTRSFPYVSALALSGLIVALTWMSGTGVQAVQAPPDSPGAPESSLLPRFTEEREAAALYFVKKHVPELLPILEQIKKNNVPQYEHEIREIFQVTEWLAD